MSTTVQASTAAGGTAARWHALSPDAAASKLGVEPALGLSAATAAQRLQQNGSNALPAEKTVPGWRRFLDQYRSYMQIILLITAIVSIAIGEWSTGAVLALLTLFNAMVGIRQEGKAESAMNALKSLTERTARVRRGGSSRPSRPSRSSSATWCCWPPATTSPPTVGSSRPARWTSTSPP